MNHTKSFIYAVVLNLVVCLTTSLAFSNTPTPTPDLPEGYDWKYNPANGHYYAYVPEKLSWTDAKNFSENLGGYLVTITSQEENDWIISTFLDYFFYNKFYIGLYRVNNLRRWVTDEPYDYENWGRTQGEIYIYVFSDCNSMDCGKWGDGGGIELSPFIIEINDDLFPTPTPAITPTPTPTPENWSSLNGSTLENNLLVAGAPAGYTQGKVSMTSIPEGTGSDGIGMEIKLAPGQGAFISSLKEFDSPSLMHLSGQFKASNKEAAIALVGLNSPIDGQIGYANVRGDEIPVDDYRQFNLIYAPPSGKVQYAIQAVNNPFSTISSTVWVDNIRVEPFEPIVGGEPVALEIDGNFEGGLEKMMVNINGDDGTVIPFFESITDVAIRMSLDPSNIAANIGTICLNLADQFPFRLLGQASVKRESLPGGGMLAMVLTNGFQNLGVFRYADEIKDVNNAVEDLLIIGGDFTVNNPDIPVSAFVQIGGPNAEVSVVVDDLIIFKQ